jgi:hypothetical protein
MGKRVMGVPVFGEQDLAVDRVFAIATAPKRDKN